MASQILTAEPTMESWIDQELASCRFADERLGKRFGMLMEQLS
jgi:hypothetical protein